MTQFDLVLTKLFPRLEQRLARSRHSVDNLQLPGWTNMVSLTPDHISSGYS